VNIVHCLKFISLYTAFPNLEVSLDLGECFYCFFILIFFTLVGIEPVTLEYETNTLS